MDVGLLGLLALVFDAEEQLLSAYNPGRILEFWIGRNIAIRLTVVPAVLSTGKMS